METDKPQYIFYLQLSNNLVKDFFEFNRILNRQNIFLIPIHSDGLRALLREPDVIILAIIPDMSSLEKYNEIKHKILYSIIKGRRAKLFEVSSFLEDIYMHGQKKSGHYNYYQLPIGAGVICRNIVEAYQNSHGAQNQWPGGRRGHLPQDGVFLK
ncbi:MAG: hypothetical protein A2504_04665 [Bdellovibrionales bacterium RIFOXYD12_FULL_39_22]|nr:MAG: hypothetical protein A2385_07160 [Bdellovibrionales bacterium RIFOXYB1_FULL_39_21]OFZ42040.1 MAG: hypothetical protein A2485_09130 [Bdellovibrionales bacterium RIFOXYC12_FULL_39_17]OFZ50756.1 MAG: hypothetical protein A2404_06080 [Bdellovibrionales bacterium RIFOXYC1_FULL_39_130]OFZ72822.1 MAG: hypothetical protein A2451_13170 [Bdellovibrionales bacterium RIFOXYC2_FULL_39_8]OFZ77979.1 MAG: hypothetical protein A2560_01250 [Bdellovibrionales bacterium RIFOXYD1_FULL_39_84]OFZ93585.1 MAG: